MSRRHKVQPRPGDDDGRHRSAFVVALIVSFVALAAALVVLAPDRSDAATLRLSFTAPSTNADNGNACGLVDTSGVEGTPMFDLHSFRLYGYLFNPAGPWGPEPVLRDTVDARGLEGQRLTIDIEVVPGTMGVVWVAAVDASGNESCGNATFVFAVPAVDPAAPSASVLEHYDLVWRKP